MKDFERKLKAAKTPKQCIKLYHATKRKKAFQKFEVLVLKKLSGATSLDRCQHMLFLIPKGHAILQKKVLKKMSALAKTFEDYARVIILIPSQTALWRTTRDKMVHEIRTQADVAKFEKLCGSSPY